MKRWIGTIITRYASRGALLSLLFVTPMACAMGTPTLNLGVVSDVWAEGETLIPMIIHEYHQEDYENRLDELRKMFGNNKEFAEEYELAALIALAHYPELREVPIRFLVTEYFMPIAAPPRLNTLLDGKGKWQFDVVISTTSKKNREHLLLENIPFNEQIGIIGHELAHIADYRQRSFSQMLVLPLCIIKPDCRALYEQETDRRNIEHGLGWQRYYHSSYVRRRFREDGINLSKNKTYMGPDKILEYMRETGLYGLK